VKTRKHPAIVTIDLRREESDCLVRGFKACIEEISHVAMDIVLNLFAADPALERMEHTVRKWTRKSISEHFSCHPASRH
jgi:hypothetical protein